MKKYPDMAELFKLMDRRRERLSTMSPEERAKQEIRIQKLMRQIRKPQTKERSQSK